MADFQAAVETLVKEKLHFQQETERLRTMETKLRSALVEAKIEIEALKEQLRRCKENGG